MRLFSPIELAILWVITIEGSSNTYRSVVEWKRDKRDVDMMVECDVHCIPYDQITDYDVLLEYEDEEDDKHLFLSDYKKKQCAFPCKIVHVNKTMETHYSPDDDFTIVSVEELPEGFKVFKSNDKSNHDPSRTGSDGRWFSSEVYDNLTKEIDLNNDTSGLPTNKEAPSNFTSKNVTSLCECASNGTKHPNNTTVSSLKPTNESSSESISPSQNTSSLFLSKLYAKDSQVNFSDYNSESVHVIGSDIGKKTTEKQTFSIIPVIPKIIRLSVFEAEMGEVGGTTSNYLTKIHKSVKSSSSLISDGLPETLTQLTTRATNDQKEELDFAKDLRFPNTNVFNNQNRTNAVAQHMNQNMKEEANPNNAPSQRPPELNFESVFSTSSTPLHINESSFQDPTEMNKLNIYDKLLISHEPILSPTNHNNEGKLQTLQQDIILKDILKHNTRTEAQTTTAFSPRSYFEGEGEHTERYSVSSTKNSIDLSQSTSKVTAESYSSTMITTISVNNINKSSNNSIHNHSEQSSDNLTPTRKEVASPIENYSSKKTEFKEDSKETPLVNHTTVQNPSNLENISSKIGNKENRAIENSSVSPTSKSSFNNESTHEKHLSGVNTEGNDDKETSSLIQTNNTELRDKLMKKVDENSTKHAVGSGNPTNITGRVENNTAMNITAPRSNTGVNSSYGLKFNNDNSGYDVIGDDSLDPVGNTTDNPSISRKPFEIGNTSIRFSNLSRTSKDFKSNDEFDLSLESADQLYNHSYRLVDSSMFHAPYLLPQHLKDSNESLGSLNSTDVSTNNVSHTQNIPDQNHAGNQTTTLHKI